MGRSIYHIKYYLLFSGLLLCLFFPTSSDAQADNSSKLEDLAKFKKSNNIDSIKIVSLDILNSEEQEANRSVIGEAYYYLAFVNLSKGLYDSAQYYLDLSIAEYEAAKDTGGLGLMHMKKGQVFKIQGSFDTAIVSYRKSIPFLEQGSDTLLYGIANDHLGHLLKNRGDYYGALHHFQNGLTAFQKLNMMYNVGIEYNSIGLIYRETKDKEKEKQAYQKAIDILGKTGESLHLGEALSNLSEIYLDEGKTEEAFELLEQAKTIFINIGHKPGLVAYNAIYAKHYQNRFPPDYDKSIEYGIRGAEMATEINSHREFSNACIFIGNAYMMKGEYSMAENWLLDGYQKAMDYGFISELSRLNEKLAVLYHKIGDNNKAYPFLRKHLTLNDSLASAEKIKEFTNLDLTFKYKQEQYRDSLEQVQQKAAMIYKYDKELKIQRLRQLILALVLIAIGIVVIFLVIAARNRKARNIELDGKNKLINQSLHEKELLLKEIHHRVRNNFQTISSLLQLQSKGVDDEKAIKNIAEGQSRIEAMALIHQKLYQENDLSAIPMQEYIEQLAKQIAASYSLNKLDIRIQANTINLDIDTAIPLGLMLNELITNSCKYAYNGSGSGIMEISFSQTSTGHYELIHKDNGPGLPEGMDPVKLKSLGLRLINRLAQQLHGKLEYSYEKGARFKITIMSREQREEM